MGGSSLVHTETSFENGFGSNVDKQLWETTASNVERRGGIGKNKGGERTKMREKEKGRNRNSQDR